MIKEKNYWTKEKCQEIALKYNSRSEFEKLDSYVYSKSLKMNWLNDICKHMHYIHKHNNYWTFDKCKDEALKYNSRSEFRNNSSSAYRISILNNWLDGICLHMKYINNYWTFDKCKDEALKYTNKSEFQKKSKGAYAFANRNNILNDICSHMIKVGNREHRCVYVFEFEDNCAYVGLTYNIIKREIEHNRKGTVYIHIKQTNSKYILKQLTDYIKKEDAQREEEYYMIKYKNEGWNLLNINKISTLGGSTIFWTYDKCKDEALKYNYKIDFIKNANCAYSSAIKNNWLNDICSHMKKYIRKNNWTDIEIKILLENYHLGINYCSKILNKSYYSIKSKYQIEKKSN